MKRLSLLFLLLLPALFLQAQSDDLNESYRKAGVQRVDEFEMVNNQKRLKQTLLFDPEGRLLSHSVINYKGKKKEVVRDTIVYYGMYRYTKIYTGKNREYDSIAFNTVVHDADLTQTETRFHRGKVVLQEEYVSGEWPQLLTTIQPGSDNPTSVHTYAYEFDEQHRVIKSDEKTFYETNGVRTLHYGYGYEVKYESQFIVHEHYVIENGIQRKSHVIYRPYNPNIDSCVMLKINGDVEYTYATYNDIHGRDSLSVMRSPDGKVTNRNVTHYTANEKVKEHYDASGALWKRTVTKFNEKGLAVSAVETYIKTDVMQTVHNSGDVTETVWVYTYF